MADLMQRGKFTFGLESSDLMAAAAYEASVLNQLGISGLENANKMMAIQGMSAQVGLEGSSFGTNFAQMLSRLAKGPEMMEAATKGMKGKAREIVEGMGITFDFFDKDRNFKGLDAMIQELEKLKLIADKAGQESALIVADALFGAEAGRPAMILAEQGLEGFKAAQERMAQQADLQQRIERITKSTANTFEALGGSLENLGAAAAGPAVQMLHPLINLLNDAAGKLTKFAEAHPTAVQWLGALVGGVLAATAAFLGLGVLMNFGRYALTGLQLIPFLGGSLTWLAGILKGALLGGLKMVVQGVLLLGRALLLNPIGLAIAGIALGAYLIYRYWEPIKGFFQEVWNRIKAVFDGGIGNVIRLILDWSPLGLFHQAFAGVLSWFGVELPKSFSEFGANMINGLVSGITSKFTEAKESIVSLGAGARDWFKEKLGINSPSTVFLGLGGNIGEGVSLGILRSIPGAREAMKSLAGVAGAFALASAGASGLPGLDPQGIREASQAVLRAESGAGGAGGMTVNFSPVIHVGSAGKDAREQVQEALQLSVRDLEQMLRRIDAERERRAY
jgi:TP901 family phage tail tape measure protein